MRELLMTHWIDKFANAFRGVRKGIVGQTSFAVNLVLSATTLNLAAILHYAVW